MLEKVFEDNMGENLDDIGNGDAFLDTTPEARSMKQLLSWTLLKLNISTL